MCAHRLLERAADRWPQRAAWSWDGDDRRDYLPLELTFGQLLAWAQATATELTVAHRDSLRFVDPALGKPLVAIAVDEVGDTRTMTDASKGPLARKTWLS